MSKYKDKQSAPKKTPEEIEDERIRAHKRRQWIARKVAHWQRMGTPSSINQHTGGACPDWKTPWNPNWKRERRA